MRRTSSRSLTIVTEAFGEKAAKAESGNSSRRASPNIFLGTCSCVVAAEYSK